MGYLRQFANDENAVVAVEYAVMLGVIVIGAFAAISSVGAKLEAIFSKLTTATEW